MPSTMIHLLAAYELEPDAPGLFRLGNFAPDFTNERELKDRIHYRDTSDRTAALEGLISALDPGDPFERGWQTARRFREWAGAY